MLMWNIKITNYSYINVRKTTGNGALIEVSSYTRMGNIITNYIRLAVRLRFVLSDIKKVINRTSNPKRKYIGLEFYKFA